MIEVTIDQTGDWAEAETPEAAMLAAITMAREAYDAAGGRMRPTATFKIESRVIALSIPEPQLWGVR